MVPAWKIGAADRALKQDVTNNGKTTGRVMKNHVPRRMSGTMNDIERQVTHGDRVAIHQPAIWFERMRFHTPACAIIVELCNPEAVFFMRPLNRQAQFFCEHAGLAAMVKMAVRHQ